MKPIVLVTAIFTCALTVPAFAQHGGGKSVTTTHGAPSPKAATSHTTTTGTATHHASAHTSASSHSSTATHPSHTTRTTTTASIPPHLATKLQSRLPAGTNLQTARTGFRNMGQFVAAVNVSRNLGIPFAQLKTRMVDQHMSLGQAIQDARPTTSNADAIASRAEHDADVQIRASKTTTTTGHK